MKAAASLLALALLSGCVRYNVPDSGVARARLGETVFVDGPSVTPLEVLEDSRCPQDTQCPWAGRVRISATVHLGSGDTLRELTLGEPIQVADGALTLVEVRPAARVDVQPFPEDYRFGFTFAGGL